MLCHAALGRRWPSLGSRRLDAPRASLPARYNRWTSWDRGVMIRTVAKAKEALRRMGWTVDDVPSLRGRVAVVTGANGGLGLETTRVLAQAGATVVMAVRDVDKGAMARDALRRGDPGAGLELEPLDLASVKSVRAAAEAIGDRHPVIDILVNNAGVMAIPFRTTVDGQEMQLAVNHLGHFALTALLMPALLRSSAGRVVSLTSTGRWLGAPVDPSDPRMERGYGPWRAYGRAKLAAVQFTVALDRRLAGQGVPVRAMVADPGFSRTQLQVTSAREAPGFGQRFFRTLVRLVGSSAATGALPQIRAATDPDAPGGSLFALRFVLAGTPVRQPRLTRHLGPRDLERLWTASERATGIRFDLGELARAASPSAHGGNAVKEHHQHGGAHQ